MRMNKGRIALFACLLIYPVFPVLPQNAGITWLDDYAEAVRQARETGKPIFLEFRCEP